ncbi:hypothetical protein RGU70_11430 [Herbaspirillum sp. RTI4]|uniref:COG4648 family protein n=1 Tax=Herbaspirillum sp. RTI4 TaxID=3048640 RepID=UPI002AB4FAE7|nr:hypothetical protein [Herbaspirillum sp. RTI4]MDY7578932.1 hypothetical protein [Herbaspirillum sp. RTI4]MEA9982021.1 hypothetical protein [Herbaspirillum sp. RTI4]
MKKHDLWTLPVLLLTLLYPLLIWLADGHVEPRWMALLLAAVAAARLLTMRSVRGRGWWAIALLALTALIFWGNAALPLKLYPVAVSVAMLALFGYSLIYPPSFIERMARLKEPDLPPQAVAYTRRVTQIWCVFFIINGSIALATALWMSAAVWSLYTGVISYGLMATLFCGEYLVRIRVRRQYHV